MIFELTDDIKKHLFSIAGELYLIDDDPELIKMHVEYKAITGKNLFQNMIGKEPYFLSNPAWYYYDEEDLTYKLTEEATPEAKKSYKDFYKDCIVGDEITFI